MSCGVTVRDYHFCSLDFQHERSSESGHPTIWSVLQRWFPLAVQVGRFELGLKLGIANAFLTGLESQNINNDTRLRKMLAEVLNTRHVTWSNLSDALKSTTVELNQWLIPSVISNLCSTLILYSLTD